MSYFSTRQLFSITGQKLVCLSSNDECDGQFVDSLQQVTLGDSHDVLRIAAHEVVLCAMAMWFESSAARTAANASEVGEIVVPPFPSGTRSLPYCWECIGPFYWTRSLRGVVAVPLV